MSRDEVVEFRQEKVKAYLDDAIRFWRKMDLRSYEGAAYYVDAYQSVRVSLFGEKLKEEDDGAEAAQEPQNSL